MGTSLGSSFISMEEPNSIVRSPLDSNFHIMGLNTLQLPQFAPKGPQVKSGVIWFDGTANSLKVYEGKLVLITNSQQVVELTQAQGHKDSPQEAL